MAKKKKESNANWLLFVWNLVSTETKKKVAGFIIVIITLGGVIYGSGYFIYDWLSHSDFFQITSIKIEGVRNLSKDMVLRLSGVDIQSNLLSLDLGEVKRKIEADKWIDTVKIKRKWPSRLTIVVKERHPVAILIDNGRMYYLDRKGVAFIEPAIGADLDFPVISGLENSLTNGEDIEIERKKYLNEALRFIRYASIGSSALPSQNISEISLTQKGELILILADRPFPIYMGGEINRSKYYRLTKVLYWLYKNKEFSSVSYINLDYAENKVLVGKNKT